jgi:hypothetical protein
MEIERTNWLKYRISFGDPALREDNATAIRSNPLIAQTSNWNCGGLFEKSLELSSNKHSANFNNLLRPGRRVQKNQRREINGIEEKLGDAVAVYQNEMMTRRGSINQGPSHFLDGNKDPKALCS